MSSPFDWRNNKSGIAEELKRMDRDRRCSEGTSKWVDSQRKKGIEPSLYGIAKNPQLKPFKR